MRFFWDTLEEEVKRSKKRRIQKNFKKTQKISEEKEKYARRILKNESENNKMKKSKGIGACQKKSKDVRKSQK